MQLLRKRSEERGTLGLDVFQLLMISILPLQKSYTGRRGVASLPSPVCLARHIHQHHNAARERTILLSPWNAVPPQRPQMLLDYSLDTPSKQDECLSTGSDVCHALGSGPPPKPTPLPAPEGLKTTRNDIFRGILLLSFVSALTTYADESYDHASVSRYSP